MTRGKVKRKDPWARFEAWRYAPEISIRANIRRAFPGFGWGIAVFLVAVAWEELYYRPRYPQEYDDAHHKYLDHGHH